MTGNMLPPPPAMDDDEDRTVQRPRSKPAATSPSVDLIADDGRVYTIHGTALIGRSPAATPSDGAVSLIVFVDDTRSLSKTHVMLRLEDGHLWVVDRASTNGTAVSGSSGTVRLEPHAVVEVFAGEYLMFGDRWCLVGDQVSARPVDTPIGASAPMAAVALLAGDTQCSVCGAGRTALQSFCTSCGAATRRPTLPSPAAGAQTPPTPTAVVQHGSDEAGIDPTPALATPLPTLPVPLSLNPPPPAPPSPARSDVGAPDGEPDGALCAGSVPAEVAPGEAPVPAVGDVEPAASPEGPKARKPIPKGRQGRKIRKVLRRRARARKEAVKRAGDGQSGTPKKRRTRRIAKTLAPLAVLAGGGFAGYQIWAADDQTASALPALATSIDSPAWTRSLDGFVGGPVSDGGDIYVTGRSATSETVSVSRLAIEDGATVWDAQVGDGSAYVVAVADDHVVVALTDAAGEDQRVLSFDAESGEAEWDTAMTLDRVQLIDGSVYLLGDHEIQQIDLETGDVESLSGSPDWATPSVFVSSSSALIGTEDGIYGYNLATMEQSVGPLPLSDTRVVLGGEDVLYRMRGDEIVVSDFDGGERRTISPDLGTVEWVIELTSDRLLVNAEQGAVVVDPTIDGAALYALTALPALVEDSSGTYLVLQESGGLTVRRASDGTEVFAGAFAGYVAASGHLVVPAESGIEALSLEDGHREWVLDTAGATASIVDGALVTTSYSSGDDQTDLAVYR